MTKISFVTLADLGDISNLKTKVSTSILKGFNKIDPNMQVLCRDYKNSRYRNVKKIIPFGRLTPYCLQGIKKYITKLFPARQIMENWLDCFAVHKIQKEAQIIYMLPPTYLKVIKKAKQLNQTVILHTSTAHPAYQPNLKSDKKTNKKRIKCITKSDYAFALSNFVKQTYVTNGYPEENIYVTPLGVDTEKFKSVKKKDNTFRIVCVANYGSLKGFQYLLKAWEELNLKNAELVFVGNPSQEMKKINKNYKKRLNNFKTVSHTDPVPYYQQSSIFVHPSLTEGSAKVTYEAMSCEKPVICTPESGSVVRNGKDGFIIPSKNVKKLKEKILYFYNNKKEIEKMGKSARKHMVNNYTWDHYSNRVYKALKDVMKRENL